MSPRTFAPFASLASLARLAMLTAATAPLAACSASSGASSTAGADAGDASLDGAATSPGSPGGPDGATSTDPGGDASGVPVATMDASADAPSGAEPPLVTQSFSEGSASILNPERGFWEEVPLVGGDFANERSLGFTVSHSYVRLDAYRSSPLDAGFLTSLQSGFDAARAAGVKVVPRFTYNFAQGDPDAPLSVIQGHIGQLQPLLAANADVIATLQAGFIGAWGEWHDSTNGLDNTTDRATIANALLSALPGSRFLQVRYPYEKDAIWGPITSATAFGGTNAARVGEHNDCFVASADDEGTYFNPPTPIDTLKAYVANEGLYSPVGGETCNLDPPRSDCPTALAELSALHWSFLNRGFDTDVLNGWSSQGCLSTIQSHLGYRVFLTGASTSGRVRPGGVLRLQVALRNGGYAAMFNARPVYAVLEGGGGGEGGSGGLHLTALLSKVDPRTWAAGAAASFEVRLRVPANVPPGTYSLALWLPDAAPSLQGKPAYAVQLANDGVWDASLGENTITTSLRVDPTAPGAVDPAAATFVEL